MASTHQETIIWIKEERTEGVSDEPGSMFVADPLEMSQSTDFIKADPELILDEDGAKNTVLEDPLNIECPSLHVKQDPEQKQHVDGFEHNVVPSTRYESDSSRLRHNSGESCDILFEEIVTQGVVHNELKIDAEESTNFSMFGTHTRRLQEEEEEEEEDDDDDDDGLCSTRLKCNMKEEEFNKFSCNFCLQNFPSKYRLIMHVFIHIDGVQPPIYVCKSCGDVFRSNVSLNKHLKKSEGDQALSPGNNEKRDCEDHHGNVFLDRDVFEQSGNQSSSKKIWKISKKSCSEICNTHTTTLNVGELDRHSSNGKLSTISNINDRAEQLTTKRIHKCDACGISFTNLSNLKTHALIHTGLRPHKCHICGKSFMRLGHLKAHVLTHTGQKSHKCDICSKSFTQVGHLKRHVLTHTGQKPYKCGICGKSFNRLGHLKGHVLTHTGQKPHKCDICSKSFTHLGELKRHGLTHTGKKPHKCDICGKSFNRLGHLKGHVLTHTGQKPHKCDICCKSFTQLGDLKRHVLTHTGQKPHKCDICGKSFTSMDNLKRHAATHIIKKANESD